MTLFANFALLSYDSLLILRLKLAKSRKRKGLSLTVEYNNIMKKIVLLVCDQFPGILTPDIPSYEYMFERVFKAADSDCEFEVFQTWQHELPESLNTEDLYLITGSNNSAYDDVAWIKALKDWIRRAYSYGCRLAGICFGHQVIAEALGGKVIRSSKGWGIGIRTSFLVDSIIADLIQSDHYSVLYDHHDQVIALPYNAVLVSQSNFCPIESFRIGKQVLTLQGHPEFTNVFIRHWIKDCAQDEPATVKEMALVSLDTMENQGIAVARGLLRFFFP